MPSAVENKEYSDLLLFHGIGKRGGTGEAGQVFLAGFRLRGNTGYRTNSTGCIRKNDPSLIALRVGQPELPHPGRPGFVSLLRTLEKVSESESQEKHLANS